MPAFKTFPASIAIFLLLIGLFIGPPNASLAQSINRYCTSRFNYCVDYPSPPFQEVQETANEDGALFTNEQMGLQLQVSAVYNVTNWTLKEIQQLEEEELLDQFAEVKPRIRQPNKDMLEISFENRGKPHFIQVVKRGEVLIFLRLWADKPMNNATFQQVRSQVLLDPQI